MRYFWVTFADDSQACVGAEFEADALVVATKAAGKTALRADQLPYPAAPVITQVACPTFCYTPRQCSGHSCCPKRYACSE